MTAITAIRGIQRQEVMYDDQYQFSIQSIELDGKLRTFHEKIKGVPLNERKQFAAELSELTFEYMDLDEQVDEMVASSSQVEAKKLIGALKGKLDKLGKAIAGALPMKNDGLMSSILDGAIAGTIAGVTASFAQRVIRNLNCPQIEPDHAEEFFDRVTVHQKVGRRGQNVVISSLYQKGTGGLPDRKISSITNRVPSSMVVVSDRGGLEPALSSRGLQLAPANYRPPVTCNARGVPSEFPSMDERLNHGVGVILCKKKISIEELNAQQQRVEEVSRALEASAKARDDAIEATRLAHAAVLDSAKIVIAPNAKPAIEIDNLGHLIDYDAPALLQIKMEEQRLTSEYNQTLYQFAQERARLYQIFCQYNNQRTWYERFYDGAKSFFGVLFEIISIDF